MTATPHIESPDDRRLLLKLARATAAEILGAMGAEPVTLPHVPGHFGGVFVTLWSGGKLRGCVGTFEPTTDIARTVGEMTSASLRDSRFASNPVTAEELDRIVFEVSVLSELEPSSDPQSLIPGVHGIMIRRGKQSGCFLPKVALERNWSSEEFLSNCCSMKAKLRADAWRDADTQVLLFTVCAFSESQPDVKSEP